MSTARIRIATRASDLALWQARYVAQRLAELGHATDLVEVTTTGDASTAPLHELGVGVFVKAVQEAVLLGRADLAVHSFKDLPATPAQGLEIAAVPPRGPRHDVLLLKPGAYEPASRPLPLRRGTRLATGAVRRTAQLAALAPDVLTEPIRGNVPTRVDKLRMTPVDGLVLAAAGLDRLDLDTSDLVRVDLDPAVFLPAPAQGALALEIRRGDPLGDVLTDLHDVGSYPEVAAERGLLSLLDAGCQLPFGAHAVRSEQGITLHAWFRGASVTARERTPEGAAQAAYAMLQTGLEP